MPKEDKPSANLEKVIQIFSEIPIDDLDTFEQATTTLLITLSDPEVLSLASEMSKIANGTGKSLWEIGYSVHRFYNAPLVNEAARIGSEGRLSRKYPYSPKPGS